jgi:hypothetical protein
MLTFVAILAAFVLLLLLVLVLDMEPAPRPGQPPPPPREGFLARGIKLMSWPTREPFAVIPATQTINIKWDRWSEGIVWNSNIAPVRICLDWSTNLGQWTTVALLAPDATSASLTLPRVRQGMFRIGYTNL